MVVKRKVESTSVKPAYSKKIYYVQRKGKNLDLMSAPRAGKRGRKKVEAKLDAQVKKGHNYYAKPMRNGNLAVHSYRRKNAARQRK